MWHSHEKEEIGWSGQKKESVFALRQLTIIDLIASPLLHPFLHSLFSSFFSPITKIKKFFFLFQFYEFIYINTLFPKTTLPKALSTV